ncbi:cyclic di-GMP receptor LapD [Pseudomonas schmalbachii]|uniref:EAL domain-containing protein n=1 Tax=Pseudomonas schmalbachii TaxID=2816993 RepID=A0ABS3TL97_9PSED|nr:EAL domain-containing protein [Pseudomonas schmalbachii]MBO3274434.1 EAL domain-containing protein [Pseudomonas schmalbachii]
MSLLKQLFLAICMFLVVAFAGSFASSVESSREQLISQLRSHAQDAATALGLSLTPHVDDPAMIELMVSSIFDSGYFSSIRVVRIADGSVIAERQRGEMPDNVPDWFANLVSLDPEGGDALIMRGWEQAARVEVISHPRFALARLWDGAIGSLTWLLACGLVSALLGGWLLRAQLRPLEQMVQQAQAISRREFLTLPREPRTPELRRVVQAMNQMVEKLKALFAEHAAHSERLREEAYNDSLSGLANRRLFDSRLDAQLLASEQGASGYLILLRLNDLAGLNQRLGGQRADALIREVADLLRRAQEQSGTSDWLAARSRGGEFTLLAPGLQASEAELLADNLSTQLENLRLTGASDCSPVAHLGLAAFHPGDAPAALLERADQALAQAQGTPERPWQRLDDASAPPARDSHDWRSWLDEALQKNRLQLWLQPVRRCTEDGELLQRKALARLPGPQGEAIGAGRFLPWVERFGWGARFDLAMLQHGIDWLTRNPEPLALSLSAGSVRDARNLQGILDVLKAHPQQARLITLEVDERHLPPPAELERMARQVRETGAGLGLQHFGGRFSLIGNLTHLGLAYLKIDGSYIRAIDQDNDKRLFIEAVSRASNSIDLPLIAEMVESEGELLVLREMGIHGAMGRQIGPPEPSSDIP